MRDRFRYFNAMVPLVACLGCRLLRSIVGPLGDVDWTLAWHELFIIWKTRSAVCLGEFPRNCKIFVFNLPEKLGCETLKLVPRKRSTSWPPCLHFGFDARTFLQSQRRWETGDNMPQTRLIWWTKWSEVKLVCPQAAREGRRRKQKHYVITH